MTRTLGRMLLPTTALMLLHGSLGAAAAAPAPPDNDEDTPPYRAMMIQKKLTMHIDYELPISCTVDKVVEELLGRQGHPLDGQRASLRYGGKRRGTAGKSGPRQDWTDEASFQAHGPR